MSKDTERNERAEFTPLESVIFLAILISGFLLVHFFVAKLW